MPQPGPSRGSGQQDWILIVSEFRLQLGTFWSPLNGVPRHGCVISCGAAIPIQSLPVAHLHHYASLLKSSINRFWGLGALRRLPLLSLALFLRLSIHAVYLRLPTQCHRSIA